jgi:hypothetical protein
MGLQFSCVDPTSFFTYSTDIDARHVLCVKNYLQYLKTFLSGFQVLDNRGQRYAFAVFGDMTLRILMEANVSEEPVFSLPSC